MAQYLSDVIGKNANLSVHGESREAQHAFGTITLAQAPVAGDTLVMLKLPPYARVTGGAVSASQIDSNGTGTFSLTVGDAGFGVNGQAGYVAPDPARYFVATTVGRGAAGTDANGSSAINGRAQNFLNNNPYPLTVYATVGTAAATFVPGSTFSLRLTFYIDEPASIINQ